MNTNCEQLAKDYQKKHNGSLIFLNPKRPSGSWILGRYSGHWLNLTDFYYDVQTNTAIGKTKQDVKDWYKRSTGNNCEIWNISSGEHPPFKLVRD